MSAPSATETSSAASSASAAPQPAPAMFDTVDFVFHIDVLLLALFGLYVLMTLPRALACFFDVSSLGSGWMLHSGGLCKSKVAADARTPKLPIRSPRWSTYIHPFVGYVLHYRVAPGFSLGRLCVLGVYFGILLYAGTFTSDPFTNNTREGFIAISQVPIVVALANKNNVLSLLSGIPYEKLNFIHRFAGRIVVLAINIHFMGFIYRWSIEGIVAESLSHPFIRWGLVGLVSLDILALFSTRYVRERWYTLFWTSHVAGFTGLLVAAYYHIPLTHNYVFAAVALIAFDRVLRLLKTRAQTATLTPLSSVGSTQITVPGISTGWRAGQHVRLAVVPPSSGVLAWLETALRLATGTMKPFTVATAAGSGAGLELVVKKGGAWTTWLYGVAKGSGKRENLAEKEVGPSAEEANPGQKARVFVEGPYGGPGYTVLASYSGAVLVAGGSGITFVLSVLEDLLQRHAAGQSRLCTIEVIWSVSQPSAITDLLPTLTALLQHPAARTPTLQLRATVHYTRAPTSPSFPTLPAEITLAPGRPNLPAVLNAAADAVGAAYASGRTVDARGRPCGVVLATCGPVEMADASAQAVGSMDWGRWKACGGVETYEEVFGW